MSQRYVCIRILLEFYFPVNHQFSIILRLEYATGFEIPEHLEEAMLRNLKTLTHNPDGLLMNNPDVPWLKDEARINKVNKRPLS